MSYKPPGLTNFLVNNINRIKLFEIEVYLLFK